MKVHEGCVIGFEVASFGKIGAMRVTHGRTDDKDHVDNVRVGHVQQIEHGDWACV